MGQGLNPLRTYLNKVYSHRCAPLTVHSLCFSMWRMENKQVSLFHTIPKFWTCMHTFLPLAKKKYFDQYLFVFVEVTNICVKSQGDYQLRDPHTRYFSLSQWSTWAGTSLSVMFSLYWVVGLLTVWIWWVVVLDVKRLKSVLKIKLFFFFFFS